MILKKTAEIIGGNTGGLRLLDVGAGSGILLEAAAEFGFKAELGIQRGLPAGAS